MSIKSIKEKQLLVNLAKSFGQDVDPDIVKEVEEHHKLETGLRKSVRSNVFEDLSKALMELMNEAEKISLDNNYPLPPSLDDLEEILAEDKNELVQEIQTKEPTVSEDSDQSIATEPTADTPEPPVEEKVITLADATAKFLTDSKDSFQQPDPLEVAPNIDALVKKVRYLEQWLSKISLAGPGGGETKLRFLDDVDRSTIGNNKFLKYNSGTNKFDFTTVTGGGVRVITDDTAPANPVDGDLWYNTLEAVMYIWLEENNVGQWVDIGDGTGVGAISTKLVTTPNYTVATADTYIGVNVASVVNITLPVSAKTGKVLMIKDESGNCVNNPINIVGQIDNDPAGATLQINNGTLQLVYRSGWRIV